MKKYPPCYLSDQDISWLEKINETTTDVQSNPAALIQFLEHIEQNYRIHRFGFFDYIPEDMDGNDVIPIFYRPEYFHAAKIYVTIQGRLALANVDTDIRDACKDKLYAFCWRQIERIEKETELNKRGLQIRVNIIYFLEILLTVAWQLKDLSVLIKAYTKVIEYFDLMKGYGLAQEILNKGFGSFSIPIEGLVNEAISLLSYPEWVSINNPKLIQCYIQAISYALDDEPCLILGETGTGKELIARTIHAFSGRRDNNFKAVNCGGFTDSLFNSELQGIIAGGASNVMTRLGIFLKATGKRVGITEYGYLIEKQKIKFRTLEGKVIDRPHNIGDEYVKSVGGTAFLDEINSLDINHQAAFLRIIQEREVNVLGEDFSRKFFVKLVCASNSNLHKLIQEGKFRADLYHRIAKGIVEVPPLRDLKESFEEIVTNRVDRLCQRIRIEKRIKVPGSTIRKLKKHQWTGNFRELDGTLYRALKKADLDNSASLKPSYIEYEPVSTKADDIGDYGGITFDSLISDYMKYLYRLTNGHQTKAAEIAGMKRNRLRDHWIKYGIIEGKPKIEKDLSQ